MHSPRSRNRTRLPFVGRQHARPYARWRQATWQERAEAGRPRGSASGDAQHRMIALPRRVFERGRNVSGFEQWVIFENFLAAGSGGQEVEHVLDADAQAPEAGTPAALLRIDRYAAQFAHYGPPEVINRLISSCIGYWSRIGVVRRRPPRPRYRQAPLQSLRRRSAPRWVRVR